MPTTFVTAAASPLFDEAFEGPEPADLENYLSPDQSEEVYCTTREREDFESDCEIAFTSDVIDSQDDYDAFVRWLVQYAKLEKI